MLGEHYTGIKSFVKDIFRERKVEDKYEFYKYK